MKRIVGVDVDIVVESVIKSCGVGGVRSKRTQNDENITMKESLMYILSVSLERCL